MITKDDIRNLRRYLNSKGRNMPSDINKIVDELCMIYEMKYNI